MFHIKFDPLNLPDFYKHPFLKINIFRPFNVKRAVRVVIQKDPFSHVFVPICVHQYVWVTPLLVWSSLPWQTDWSYISIQLPFICITQRRHLNQHVKARIVCVCVWVTFWRAEQAWCRNCRGSFFVHSWKCNSVSTNGDVSCRFQHMLEHSSETIIVLKRVMLQSLYLMVIISFWDSCRVMVKIILFNLLQRITVIFNCLKYCGNYSGSIFICILTWL